MHLPADLLEIGFYYYKKHLFLDLDFWILNLEFLELSLRFGALGAYGLFHFSVPTSYRLKFTNIRRENFWIQIFLDLGSGFEGFEGFLAL